MIKRLTSIALVLFVCLALTLGIAPGVSAGDTVGMEIDPTPKEVGINEIFTVDIVVTITAGEAVDTAGAYINFDPTYLEVLGITAGTTFTSPLGSSFNNGLGTINYAAGAPSGSNATSTFVLATIEFESKDVTGTTPLTFVYESPLRKTKAVSVGTDILDHGAVMDGNVTIICQTTLEGHVNLQGRSSPPHTSWITPLTVSFLGDGAVATTTDNVGNFTIADVTPGIYDICVKSPRALSELVTGVEMVVCETTSVDFGTLREGDANDDDVVDELDYSLLHFYFWVTSGEGLDKCDFNRDGVVDELDYSLLHSNFWQIGDCYAS